MAATIVNDVRPSKGESNQFVYIRRSYLLSTYECKLEWNHKCVRQTENVRKISRYAETGELVPEIGFVIPSQCSGDVTITCFDYGDNEIGRFRYQVIEVTGPIAITGFLVFKAKRWVFIEGHNFRRGSYVVFSKRLAYPYGHIL